MSDEGIIVSYNTEKGFGFIKSATVDRDVFFHVSAFRHVSVPTPHMRVVFDVKVEAGGRKSASNIELLEVPEKARPKSDAHPRRPAREETPISIPYTAYVEIKEGSWAEKSYYGDLKLTDRQLQFEGKTRFQFSSKKISRSLRFVSSVEKQAFEPYVIKGGGPILIVTSARFLGGDLKTLINALRKRL